MAVEVQRRYDKDSGKTLSYVTDHEKRKEPFVVIPHRKGYAGYEVFTHKGETPKQLSGQYIRLTEAIGAVTDYLDQMVPSKSVQRDARAEEREARKAKEN